MALQSTLSNNYDPTQGFGGGIRNLGYILSQGPAMRARGRLLGAESNLYQARAGQAGANASLADAKTQDLIRKGSLVDTMQKIYPIAEAKMTQGDFDAPEVQTYLGATAGLLGTDPKVLESGIKQSLGTRLALTGRPDMAADVQNPVSTANNRRDVAERAGRPVNIPAGGTMASPTGAILAQGAADVPQGDIRTGPISGTNAPPIVATNPKPVVPVADVQRQKLAADYILKQAEANPTNTVSGVVGEYDKTINPLASKLGGKRPATANIITDKDGAQWRYHGSMADPTQDQDESNWEQVQ